MKIFLLITFISLNIQASNLIYSKLQETYKVKYFKTGELRLKSVFKGDKRVSTKTFFKNGKLKAERFYNGDKIISEIHYNKNGTIYSISVLNDKSVKETTIYN